MILISVFFVFFLNPVLCTKSDNRWLFAWWFGFVSGGFGGFLLLFFVCRLNSNYMELCGKESEGQETEDAQRARCQRREIVFSLEKR